MPPPASKDALRRTITVQRHAATAAVADDAARTRFLLQALGTAPGTVALYASRPGEPGTGEAIDALHELGWEVLLPTLGATPGWAVFRGWDTMREGWGGIAAPAGPVEGVELSVADVVVVAALAVSRDGTRLGTGGGWYDRALPHRREGAPVWALTRTEELVETLPAERHDVPVDMVFTPDGAFGCGDTAVRGIGKPWPGPLS